MTKYYNNLDLQSALNVVNSADAANPGDLTPLSQVEALISAATLGASKGIVNAATTAVLPACTYANGTSGVGATLTGDANGALAAVDGVTLTINQVVLVKDQADASENGSYTVTQVGDAGTPFILTRTDNFNQASEMTDGSYFLVVAGTANEGTIWILASAITTVGTDDIDFALQRTVVAGTAVSVTAGNTVNVKYDGTTIGVNGSNELYALLADNSVALTFNSTTDWSGNNLVFSAGDIGLGTGALSVYIMDNTGNMVAIDNAQVSGGVTFSKVTALAAFAGTAVFVAA